MRSISVAVPVVPEVKRAEKIASVVEPIVPITIDVQAAAGRPHVLIGRPQPLALGVLGPIAWLPVVIVVSVNPTTRHPEVVVSRSGIARPFVEALGGSPEVG
jgi:hypothetical protein